MKRKLFVVLVSLCLMLALLPAHVFAETEYDVWVRGVRVSASNKNDVCGDGRVSYDPATGTLTLNGYVGAGIIAYQDLHIKIAAGSTNQIYVTDGVVDSAKNGICLYTDDESRFSLVIDGDGELYIETAHPEGVRHKQRR